MSDEGFTSLRLNSGGNEVQEGFWPSFTDIMTVIVMIFLIAMVVLLLRNMELISQLRATMEAERVAAELARATGEEKDSLVSALHRAEEQVQRLQLELMRLQDKGVRNETLIAEQMRAISALSNERDDLVQQAAQLGLLRQRLEEDLARRQAQLSATQRELDERQLALNAAQRSVATLEDDLAQLRNRQGDSLAEIERLQRALGEQRDSLEQERRERLEFEQRYLVLADDFDDLKVKYDKLVRPARTATGRHVVEVRYWKEDGSYRITWREGSEGGFQAISRSQLDNVLTRLAASHADGLFVKVIIPENSGLSYNEAWEFTSHLHSNYDYYFKAEAAEEGR